ncbi:MAG: CinA family protein [Pseudomonadota bacterium]
MSKSDTPLADISAQAAELLKNRAEKVVVCESSTAGLISASLLAVPGASAYFEGGAVVYTLASRKVYLSLSRADVEGLEPLTEAMVMRFAEVARQQMGTTWAISELGVAGPAGARYGHPPGISVLAVDGPVRLSTTIETGSDQREENMWAFTSAACNLLADALQQAQDQET